MIGGRLPTHFSTTGPVSGEGKPRPQILLCCCGTLSTKPWPRGPIRGKVGPPRVGGGVRVLLPLVHGRKPRWHSYRRSRSCCESSKLTQQRCVPPPSIFSPRVAVRVLLLFWSGRQCGSDSATIRPEFAFTVGKFCGGQANRLKECCGRWQLLRGLYPNTSLQSLCDGCMTWTEQKTWWGT